MAPLKHESELKDKANLELSMKVEEEDSPMQSTSIQTGKSEYRTNDAMASKQPSISSDPLATIGSFIYHNFECIDKVSLAAEREFEATHLNLMLKRASKMSNTDI